jgi:hypothetical protein
VPWDSKLDQAVLSQFSHKLKKVPANRDGKASEEAIELEVEKELDMLEEEISCFGVGDEEPEYDVENDEDGIAEDIDISDALVVEDVICEASQSIHLDALPVSEANIGCVCIAKVNCGLSEWVVQSTNTLRSFVLLLSRLQTALPSRRNLNSAACRSRSCPKN